MSPDRPHPARGRAATALLFLPIAVMGACIAVVGFAMTWGGWSLRLPVLLLGGVGVLLVALVAPLTMVGPTDVATGVRNGQRVALALLLACVVLLGVVLTLGFGDDDDVAPAWVVRRLEAEVTVADLSEGNERYYADLYGPAYDADETQIVSSSELGILLVVGRAGGYDRDDEAHLRAVVRRQTANPDADAVVHRGVAVLLMGGGPDDAVEQLRRVLSD